MLDGTVLRKGFSPEQRGYPAFGYERKIVEGLVMDKDLAIPLRDGVEIYGDLYRPQGEGPLPILIAWSPYGKHGFLTVEMFPGSDIDPTLVSSLFHFEGPDPVFWCSAGYGVLFVDPRGSWGSNGGPVTFFTKAEALDYYDTIEWAARQSWSTGRIGLAGQSYFSITQWMVAGLRPPHLTCIAPWGACSDRYRDSSRHGGIPETVFSADFINLGGVSRGLVEDQEASLSANPFIGDYYDERTPDLSAIDVPAYIVADWTDQGLHSRGTIEAYLKLTKGPKWFEINGRKKWARYYQPEFRDRLRAFYDRFLKDDMEALADWPPVRIEVREAFNKGKMRDEHEWPLARTAYRPFYLDFATGSLTTDKPVEAATHEHDAVSGTLTLEHRFGKATEITGHSKLRLWVEANGADDMDLFVKLVKLAGNGEEVNFPLLTIFNNGPVANGWLRVSQRELDAERSTEYRPWLRHKKEMRLSPGEVVKIDVEILASSTQFEAGETLRLVVGGHDLVDLPIRPGSSGHKVLRNAGTHKFYTGAGRDSHLLLPFID